MVSFDDFDNDNSPLGDLKPFQFRDDKTEEGTLKWLVENFDQLQEDSFQRMVLYRRYLARYKNSDVRSEDGMVKSSNRDRNTAARKPRVRVNFFYDLIESKVSQVSRMKTNTVFIPDNYSEQKDRNNASVCNLLARHRF